MARMKQSVDEIAKLANHAYHAEDFTRAMILYRKALKIAKNDADLLKRYGHVLVLAGHVKEGSEQLDRAHKRRPNHLPTLMVMAFARLRSGDIEGAHEKLDRVLDQDPDHGGAILAKVNLCTDSGHPELAQQVVEQAMHAKDPDPLVYIAQARLARSTKEFSKGIDAANEIINRPGMGEKHLLAARFALGHLLDATGEYDQAFEAFYAANMALPPAPVAHADSVIGNWSSEFLDSLDATANESQRPVIVVGMPRSGTTLTEQIISAHPLADTVGEAPIVLQQLRRTTASNLTTEILTGYADEYLAYLEEEVEASAERVVDKHMNADKSIGMISKMFPNARFVHCLRDAADCCLSAYFQNFGHNLPYSRDLRSIGNQYVAHRRMMDHWNEVLDRPIFTNVYEDLVDDPETHVRGLLNHLGLAFDESCLRFHESKKHVLTASATQVRKPIYASSKQRWRNYEKHLGPLLEILGSYQQI